MFELPHGESRQVLPDVRILYGYAGDDGKMVAAAAAAGAKGIIYAGMGNGSLPEAVEQELARAAAAGVIAVRSTRSPAGCVVTAEASYEQAGILASGSLNPAKSRILLQLALASSSTPAAIKDLFRQA